MLKFIFFTLILPFFYSLSLSKTFKFNPEGTFTILQLTDLHYGESQYQDDHNMKIQDELIKRVKPDLVVVSGDAVSGYAYHGQPDFLKNAWNKFSHPFIENQVFYAFTMGNHDIEGIMPEEIYELEKENPLSLCLLSQDVSHGNFNYYIPIYSSQGEIDSPTSIIWIFDSHSTGCAEDQSSWGCVRQDELEWYRQKSEEIRENYGTNIHHVGFVHIPLPEYMDLYNDHEFYGNRYEEISCPLVNTGLFEAIKNEENIQALFVGHDHNNDYGGWLDGIELVYGRKTGYGGYGPMPGIQRGGRVIKLRELKDQDGIVHVEREHYVIEEFPEQEDEVERLAQLELKRRKGPRQVVCSRGGGSGMGIFWILFGVVAVGGGIGIAGTYALKSFGFRKRLMLRLSLVKKRTDKGG